jgi:hypothetical protein
LHRHLISLTNHDFNLANPIGHGAFVSLVQPTAIQRLFAFYKRVFCVQKAGVGREWAKEGPDIHFGSITMGQ